MALITNNWLIDSVCIILGLATLLYIIARYVYSFWERNGFKTLSNVSLLFGHFTPVFTQTESFGDFVMDLYRKTSEPFIGMYGVIRPMLLVRDPELVRAILVRDFNHFTDRGVHCDEENDPLSGNLVNLPGQKWKNLRGKLSPTFTSGKLKSMFSTLVNCGDSLQNYLNKATEKTDLVNIRELSACFATDIISSVAFGIEVDTISDPNNDFRKFGRKIFEPTLWNGLKAFINFSAPKLMSLLRLRSVDADVEHFINSVLDSVVKETLDYREKNNISRKDFFQLLIQLRNNGTVQLDDEWDTIMKSDEKQKSMSFNEIAAQTFVFYVAGFETSSSTASFCLHEIAKNPHIQTRVQNEIDHVVERFDNKITYESVSDMKYLECCIDETLRKYPIASFLTRTCVKDYQIPGTNKIVKKGTEMFIPVIGLHHDEKYYPEPEKFEPERFSTESSVSKNQLNRPYMPFGDGPRNCIGMRLGKMQTKVALVMMLQKFKYEMEPEKIIGELIFDSKSFLLAPRDGIKLRVFKR